MNKLILATHNAHKTGEIAAILGAGWSVLDLTTLADFPTPEETGSTLRENAEIKALSASARTSDLVLADDSGLEVDALDGAPGVYSARFAGPAAHDADNRQKLARELALVGVTHSPARFRCVLAVAKSGRVLATFSGAVEGVISPQERGAHGFGYDPMFVPAGHAQTFAELSATVKNGLSHRGRALQQFIAWASENAQAGAA